MRRRTPGAVRSLGAVATAVAVLATGGCGDNSSSSSPAGDPASTGTSPPADSRSPEPAATPDTRPASGPLLNGKVATIRAPGGFRKDDSLVRWMHTASDPDGDSSVTLTVTPAIGGLTSDDMAAVALRHSMPEGSRQLPDVTLDGVDFYRVAGSHPDGMYVEEYAAEVDKTVGIVINVDDTLPRAERRDLVTSVLASFRWS